jgi:hypothetical protein
MRLTCLFQQITLNLGLTYLKNKVNHFGFEENLSKSASRD